MRRKMVVDFFLYITEVWTMHLLRCTGKGCRLSDRHINPLLGEEDCNLLELLVGKGVRVLA